MAETRAERNRRIRDGYAAVTKPAQPVEKETPLPEVKRMTPHTEDEAPPTQARKMARSAPAPEAPEEEKKEEPEAKPMGSLPKSKKK